MYREKIQRRHQSKIRRERLKHKKRYEAKKQMKDEQRNLLQMTNNFRSYLVDICLNEENQNENISLPMDCLHLLNSMINISIIQKFPS